MRRSALLLALPFLAGCSGTDVGSFLNFPGSGSDQQVAVATPAAAPVAAPVSAGAPDPFCLGVARGDATGNSFDATTLARVAQRSYAQCVAIFGSPP